MHARGSLSAPLTHSPLQQDRCEIGGVAIGGVATPAPPSAVPTTPPRLLPAPPHTMPAPAPPATAPATATLPFLSWTLVSVCEEEAGQGFPWTPRHDGPEGSGRGTARGPTGQWLHHSAVCSDEGKTHGLCLAPLDTRVTGAGRRRSLQPVLGTGRRALAAGLTTSCACVSRVTGTAGAPAEAGATPVRTLGGLRCPDPPQGAVGLGTDLLGVDATPRLWHDHESGSIHPRQGQPLMWAPRIPHALRPQGLLTPRSRPSLSAGPSLAFRTSRELHRPVCRPPAPPWPASTRPSATEPTPR